MARAKRAKSRPVVAVLNPSGRYTYLTPEKLRQFERQRRISRDAEGRWSFNGVFRHALTAAKGRVHRKMTKPGWNGSGPAGGGIFRSRPRVELDIEQTRYNAEIAAARPDANGTDEAADEAVFRL